MKELIFNNFESLVFNKLKNKEDGVLLSYKKSDEIKNLILELDEDELIIFISTLKKDQQLCKIDIGSYNEDEEEEREAGEEALEFIAEQIRSLVSHLLTHNENCEGCDVPFGFVNKTLKMNSKRHSLFHNLCDGCGNEKMPELFKLYHQHKDLEELTCNICEDNCVKRVDEEQDKIIYKEFVKLTCCKNKHICNDCRNIIKNQYKNKCSFCRQDLVCELFCEI